MDGLVNLSGAVVASESLRDRYLPPEDPPTTIRTLLPTKFGR